MKRSMSWTGRGWPSLAQNDCACAANPGAASATAKSRGVKNGVFRNVMVQQGSQEVRWRGPKLLKVAPSLLFLKNRAGWRSKAPHRCRHKRGSRPFAQQGAGDFLQ
jgi:hypothetical protein